VTFLAVMLPHFQPVVRPERQSDAPMAASVLPLTPT
jgi:hypothetical protein